MKHCISFHFKKTDDQQNSSAVNSLEAVKKKTTTETAYKLAMNKNYRKTQKRFSSQCIFLFSFLNVSACKITGVKVTNR